MADTPNLTLPLLAASQAQKHVTVNEALMRLDGAVQLRLRSITLNTPPLTVLEGECFGVAAGAVNDWAGHEGEIAQFSGGGWSFFAPARGWRGFVEDSSASVLHDGTGWRAGGLSLTPGGAGVQVESLEADIPVGSGPLVSTGLMIPARSVVLGVTARVTEAMTGPLASWQLGDGSSVDRYGNGLGLALNSWANGPVSPFVIWTDSEILMTASGGIFAGGRVTLAAHFLRLTIPDAV